MSGFCWENIGGATWTWVVSKAFTRKVQRIWTRNPTGQGLGWINIEKCSSTCSSEHTLIRGPDAHDSYLNRGGEDPSC